MTRNVARRVLAVTLLALFALLAPAGLFGAEPVKRVAATKPAAKPAAKKKAPAKAVAQGERVDATAEGAWAKARALAEDDRHAEALDVLEDALAKHPDDTSLRWLEAGVTGWSGRHHESVALYEKLIANHPGMADDVRLDLARERLWSGDAAGALRDLEAHLLARPDDTAAERLRALALARAERHDEAVEAYDILLLGQPSDPELMLGRAQALAWGGHHEQASGAYRRMLEHDPANMDARMGVARNQNWAGNHREAASMFQDILRDPEADPEALKGLAFAEYWAGRADRAYAPLERYQALRPHDPEGDELARMLAREFHPGLTAGYDWSSDSDDLRIFTTTVEYRLTTDRRGAVAFLWRRDHVKDDAGEREPYRFGVGHERTWTDLWSSRAYLWSVKPGSGISERGMGEVSLAFRPSDRVTFDAGYEKTPVLTRLALERDIDIRTGSVGLDWRVRPRLRAEAAHAVSRYSDENRARRTSAGLEFLLVGRRRFEAVLTAGHEVVRVDSDPGNGYYAPSRYTETAPGLVLRWRPRAAATIEFEGRVGRQKEAGSDAEEFHNLRLMIDTPVRRGLSLYTLFETSDSSLSTASGYEQHRWAAYLSVPF